LASVRELQPVRELASLRELESVPAVPVLKETPSR
jgi:hypothetical protein